jgi:hypothetical protein
MIQIKKTSPAALKISIHISTELFHIMKIKSLIHLINHVVNILVLSNKSAHYWENLKT